MIQRNEDFYSLLRSGLSLNWIAEGNSREDENYVDYWLTD